MSKSFEKALRSQITSFLEREQLWSIGQFDYRKQISTIDLEIDRTNKIRTQQEKNVTGAFLDLSNAFHSINHTILLRKFENMGFDEEATNLIEKYLIEKTANSCPKRN